MKQEKDKVPLWEKYALTVNEAMEYFNIGEKKMRRLITDHAADRTFVVLNGNKALIIRKRFEKFLDETGTI